MIMTDKVALNMFNEVLDCCVLQRILLSLPELLRIRVYQIQYAVSAVVPVWIRHCGRTARVVRTVFLVRPSRRLGTVNLDMV